MKRLFLLLFCVCALWLFALFAFAEEAPALAQVEHVASTLSDDTVVTLQWEAVEDATGYKVTLYNEEADKFKTILTTTATLGVIPGLERGKTYRFRVRAFQKTEAGNRWGAPSIDVYAVTAPYALKKLRVADLSTDTVTLRWKVTTG